MVTISRSEALDNLLLGIYENRNVNFENQKVIINDDRIRKTLYSPTSTTNFRHLLEVTFNDTGVIFEDKKKGKNFALDKERVIDNSVEYFKELGIYIPVVLNMKERYLLGKRMCCAILEHILPVIFSNINTEKGKRGIEKDNISPEFNKAVDCIKSQFSSGDFFEQLYVNIKSSDVEKLYDSDYNEKECNFGVLVCSTFEHIFDYFNFLPTISYYACNDNKQPTAAPNKENNRFTELTSKFISSMVLDNQNFVSPYYYIEKPNNVTEHKSMEYTISFNVDFPNSSFIPRYFYFMTKIDDRTIDEKYSSCDSAFLLNKKLIEKAIRQIRLKYMETITEYYQQIFANIEILCSKFLAIDVERLLSQNIYSIVDFKKALNTLCNEDDIDKVWGLCKENRLSEQQAIRYIYCGIETVIQDFLNKISDSLILNEDKAFFLHAVEDYVPKSSIAKHTNALSTLLKKSKIDELSNFRVKYNNFNWNPNVGLKMYYRNDANTLPIHDKSEDVYRCLKSTITYYCNALNNIEL
ncbi:MAG: hypothetical protein ACI4J2_02965 [Ruminococcus sp.]